MPAPVIPSLTPSPPAPLRSQSPALFTLTAETFVDWQSDFSTEMNLTIAGIGAMATYMEGLTGSSGPIVSTALTMATARILGRTTASSGAIEEITIGSGLSLAAGTLSATATTYTDEMARDAIGTALVQGTGITITVDDGADTITIAATAGSLTLASTVTQSGTPVATSVGFLGSPQMADQDDYTLALTDSGGHYYHVSATPHTLTIPANASVAFPIGTVIAIVNENGAGAITLAITSDTLRWGSSTGSRTIAANGTASLVKVTSTVWRLTGDGIS